MDETLTTYFSAKTLQDASTVLSRSGVDYDDLIMAIADNLPLRYQDSARLAEAYEFVSHADMFRGRIGTEHWQLLKYFYNDLSKAAAVDPGSYRPFKFIAPPIRIITLFWTKGKRTALDDICSKIGQRNHVSRKTAKEEFVPFLKFLLDRRRASDVQSWLELSLEEVEFLQKMNKF